MLKKANAMNGILVTYSSGQINVVGNQPGSHMDFAIVMSRIV